MQFLTDIPSASAAIMAFAMGPAARLPSGAAPLFARAAGQVSPVDAVVQVAEHLYANQAAITDPTARAAAQTLCAQCAALAAQFGWHGMGARGPGLIAAMRRELGEPPPAGFAWPASSADPAPRPQWAPAASPAQS
jgi:hypothetical protein